ncbi:MAG: peptidylprolyl isomerase [Bdellovibrionales bacterium]|nr:peptidylprolyl isomerase [Bdellovibrionales bacterium]
MRKILSGSCLTLMAGLTLITAQAHSALLERLEASVNSSTILSSDVTRFKKTLSLRSQLDPLFSSHPLSKKGASASHSEVVDFLITEVLISQQFPVTDAEVEQEINSIQANNRITRDALKNAIEGQGFNFDDYFELIRVGTSKRNLIDREIRTRVSISDDDVKNYFYNRYAKQNTTPTAYRFRILTVTPTHFKNASGARETVERALKAIRAGEAFEEVAKQFSDDASAPNGGDLGTLTSDQINSTLRDQLKKMKIGEVSDVLGDAKSRYFVLKLEDLRSAETERYEKMKEEIRSQLAAGEYQRQIVLWIERQRETAFVHTAGSKTNFKK